MTFGAIITMVVTMGIVTIMCAYFFIKILKAPPPKADDEGTGPGP